MSWEQLEKQITPLRRLNGLDLFSGIAGTTLALRDYIKTIAYCENDRHAQSVLLSRMADGSIEPTPIWDDITTLTGKQFDKSIDIIVGGFPCQDISVAGKQAGIQRGNRSGLFYEIMRLTDEIRPRFLFLENVPAIRTRGLDIVLQELTQRGYDCRWAMLSAAQVGAPHKRERWFMLANQRDVADSNERGLQTARSEQQTTRTARKDWKYRGPTESNLGGVANGFSNRLDEGMSAYLTATYWQKEPENIPRVTQEREQRVERIKRLGNSVVPLQAKTAFEYLIKGLL